MHDDQPWPQDIPLLAGARLLRQLAAGDCADNWLVQADYDRYVVRVDKPLAARLGLDRTAEWLIQLAAHQAGFAPRPLYLDRARGVLVTQWIDQAAWLPADLAQPRKLESLGRRLRQLHEQPGVGTHFDPHAIAQRYARVSGAPGLGPAVDEVGRLAEQLYPADGWALCHHDPHAGNLLGHEPLLLVDWEYAACGQPLFDLAVVIRYHGLGQQAASRLLSAWAGNAGTQHRERLTGFCRLYDLMAGLWQGAVNSSAVG
jgi:thiamine kinase